MAARRLNMVVFMAMVVAAVLQSSAAQTTHVVGDGLGWNVPPGGPIAYSTWASRQTFTVGDVLVFNFSTGVHDVAEVTKAAFDACNSTSPISIATDGPKNITLNSAGEHYYICTFARHCDLGQKLAINVSATSAPSSPPAPTPSRAPETHVVGDDLGWNVPPGGPIAYQTWAFNNEFLVGDTLVFNYTTGVHDVAEVTRAAFDSCNSTNPISIATNGPTSITLNSVGSHYYICTFARHCDLGQKLAINVSATSAPSPQPAATPSPSSPPTPTPASVPAPTPSPVSTPPSPTASPPSPTATPPTSTASPPSTTVTPPSTTTPSTPSPAGSLAPPPPNSSAPSFAIAAVPITLLSIVVALLY
uniref:Putative blue copper protein n=1 Tax=Davidia involucrata TaxID=16924 RepID=A0A5B6YU11_DAVIN